MRRPVYTNGKFRLETEHILSYQGKMIARFTNLSDAKKALEGLSKSTPMLSLAGRKPKQ